MAAPAMASTPSFAAKLIRWQKKHGRHDLPWQGTRDPYRIWVSEIMLQQTQVASVIPYFERFLQRFPTVASLARAPSGEVMQAWSGLGYYSRARNLHAAAKIVLAEYRGQFPQSSAAIGELPGIGRSTAAAIAAFAFGERAAILDGNVKRVLCRAYGIAGFPGDKRVEAKLWALAESLLPKSSITHYTQALMDLGATLCRRGKPDCVRCPLNTNCVAYRDDRTGELPAPRPRKTIPVRDTAMLLLKKGGKVLIELRPPSGIWGGLWSLPEAPLATDWNAWCKAEFGLRINSPEKLAPLRHGFTHFTLAIQPVKCEVVGTTTALQEPRYQWIAMKDVAGAALPAPVKKLLLAMNSPSP